MLVNYSKAFSCTCGHDDKFWLVNQYFVIALSKPNRGKQCHKERWERNNEKQCNFLGDGQIGFWNFCKPANQGPFGKSREEASCKGCQESAAQKPVKWPSGLDNPADSQQQQPEKK